MRYLSNFFYMILAVSGISYFILAGLIGFQYFSGKVTDVDLENILRVLAGNYRIVLPDAEYNDYINYKENKKEAEKELEENRGLPSTRVPAVIKSEESAIVLRENLSLVNKQLEAEKKKVLDVRAEVESQKKQVEALKKAFDQEKQKNLIVEKDAMTAKFQNTLANMDAGDVANFLSAIIKDPSMGGPVEAARIVRNYLKADFSAEVLSEMPELDREKIIPLLEDKFAGVPPEAVVEIFKNEKTSLGEQLIYLLQMNSQQALGVYIRLSQDNQEQLAQQLLKTQ